MAAQVLTVDTSIAVPAVLSWHPLFEQCRALIAPVRWLTGHALAETYRVLTAMPGPGGLTVEPRTALDTLNRAFPDTPAGLDGWGYLATVDVAAEAGLRTGAIYDAVIAASALAVPARLLSRDRRAVPAYRAIGVDFEIIELGSPR